jgi:sugar/nucleoside kinase (ribokinase family)
LSLSDPAVKVKVVDTTGAGDAFNGGFLSGILKGYPKQEALALGNRVGGLSTRMAGGIDGLPQWDEIH